MDPASKCNFMGEVRATLCSVHSAVMIPRCPHPPLRLVVAPQSRLLRHPVRTPRLKMCPAVDGLDGLAAQEGPSVSEDVRTGSPTSGAVPDTVPSQVVAAPVDQAKRHLVLIILTLSILVDNQQSNENRGQP